MQQTLAQELSPTPPQSQAQTQASRMVVSLEVMAYLLLLLLAVTFRVANLDSVPMTVQEAPAALAAWRSVSPTANAFPEEIATDNPVVFWAQKIGFTLFGDSEFAARIVTALAGIVLVLTPLLFRGDLGRARTLVFCILLAFSPVMLLASRSSEGMVWALLFGMIGIWALRRYVVTSQNSFAVGAITALGAMAFCSDAGGLVLLVIFVVAAVGARLLTTLDTLDETPNPTPLADITGRIVQIPLLMVVGLAALILAAAVTGFMTYPAGLSGVGELFSSFLHGFAQRPSETPGLYPLLVSIYYEPLLWVFAGVGVFLLIQQRAFTLFDRFFLLWLAGGLVAVFIYPGSMAAHALWLTLPLIALATSAIAGFFGMTQSTLYWEDDPDDDVAWLNNARTGRWIMAVATLVLVTILAMHLQSIGRTVLTVEGGTPNGLFTMFSSNGQTVLRSSVIWSFISLLFLLVGGLLGASIWSNLPTIQGMALGLVAFMLINGLSAGWNAAVFEADNAVEPWHFQASSSEIPQLRQTLLDLSDRETLGYRELPITIVQNPLNGLTRDGIAAWLVRDFQNVTFADDIDGARAAKVVIMTQEAVSEHPELGGSYVGQGFALVNSWSFTSLNGLDFIPWWFQRKVRTAPVPMELVTLWVRLDVYEGVNSDQPAGESPAG